MRLIEKRNMVDLKAAAAILVNVSPQDLQLVGSATLKELKKLCTKALQHHSEPRNSVEILFDAIQTRKGWKKVEGLDHVDSGLPGVTARCRGPCACQEQQPYRRFHKGPFTVV